MSPEPPSKLEAYRKKSAVKDEQAHEWEAGREVALVGIFKTRFLKRLESSIEAFRLSLRRALTFGLSETPVRSPSMWFWNADQTWRSAKPT